MAFRAFVLPIFLLLLYSSSFIHFFRAMPASARHATGFFDASAAADAALDASRL